MKHVKENKEVFALRPVDACPHLVREAHCVNNSKKALKGFAEGVQMEKPLVVNNCSVYFNEIFGSQEYKRKYLTGKSIFAEKLIKLEDDKKYHWFSKVSSNEKYWNEFKCLNEIFNLFGSGVSTERDYITIHKT